MGLFSKGDVKAKPADADGLRRALRLLLIELGAEVPRKEADRVDDLLERIDRYPMPSGLEREVERLIKYLRTSALGAGSADFADTVTAMTDAMQRVSILDRDLTQTIKDLKDQIPLRVRPGDARLLAASERAVEGVAEQARHRQRVAQEAMVSLLDAVGMHLQEANLSTDKMEGHLGQLAQRLADARDAPALFELRGELNQVLVSLREVSKDVRSDLVRARARVSELESTVQKQTTELNEARVEMSLDSFTGVANRSAFDQALVQALVESRRTNGLVSLLIMDLDHFKKINDTYGHPSGDDVLRAVSKAIVAQVRNDDFVARIGGEEFAALLLKTGKREAASVAARVRDAVRALSFSHGSESFGVTISLGLASWDRAESAEQLYARSDGALYQAKRTGRDRYVVV